MSNAFRVSKLSAEHVSALNAVIAAPGSTLAQLAAALDAHQDLDQSSAERARLLANRIEHRLSALIDEALITRSVGGRDTATYRAA
jgi:hypothetical protein